MMQANPVPGLPPSSITGVNSAMFPPLTPCYRAHFQMFPPISPPTPLCRPRTEGRAPTSRHRETEASHKGRGAACPAVSGRGASACRGAGSWGGGGFARGVRWLAPVCPVPRPPPYPPPAPLWPRPTPLPAPPRPMPCRPAPFFPRTPPPCAPPRPMPWGRAPPSSHPPQRGELPHTCRALSDLIRALSDHTRALSDLIL